MSSPEDIARIFADEHGRAVAVLVRVFGDIDVAEDAAQDAFAEALRRWPRDGVPPEELLFVDQPTPSTEAIDGAVPGRGRDPRSRVRGHTALRPDLEGRDEGVLHRLLGEVEVAEDADERRDRPSGFLAEQAVDDLVSCGLGNDGPQRAAASTAGLVIS